jgi:hypothetical protein
MERKQALLGRLDAIGRALEKTGQALALIGLGSVGLELDRLDDYSDLDFFAIVKPGCKAAYIEKLDWLNAAQPIAYAFRNTVDGYKALFDDGLFCEFAVFEPAELAHIPFARGRIVWQDPSFDPARAEPTPPKNHPPQPLKWHIGEILTNLYVGLGRYRRGEKLSAFFFVQQYAVARLVEISDQLDREAPAHRDPFAHERRYEQRFPNLAQHPSRFTQGYDRTPESARAILEFVEAHVAVNPAIKQAILKLCEKR